MASEDSKERFKNWQEMYLEERRLLEVDKNERPSGICLSGGGVRAAVTCIGILSSLSKAGVLKHLHYVSTVSGGGYAGAAMTVWLQQRFGTKSNHSDAPGIYDLPFVAEECFDTKNKPKPDTHNHIEENQGYIRHVRANISYLMPNGMMGILRGTYVFSRAAMLSIFVWLTLAMAVFFAILYAGRAEPIKLAPDAMATCIHHPEEINGDTDRFFRDRIFGGVLSYGTPVELCIPVQQETTTDTETQLPKEMVVKSTEWSTTAFGWSLVLAVISAAVVAVLLFSYPIITYLGALFYHKLHLRKTSRSDVILKRYRFRRSHEKLASYLLMSILICSVFGLVPLVSLNLEEIHGYLDLDNKPEATKNGGLFFGTISLLVGITTSLLVAARERLGKAIGMTSATFLVLGCILFVGGIVILAFNWAYRIHIGEWPFGLAIALFVFALALAFFCSINDISLGRFYRDRLIEAFMPERTAPENGRLAQVGREAEIANKLTFKDLLAGDSDNPTSVVRPLHLVNTAVAPWWSNDTRARRRRADNFVLSPVGGGSDTTNWWKTDSIAAGKLTLATAISASGAAANPGAGFAGSGPTTTFPVALSMSLLNLRLGYWLRLKETSALNPYGNRFNPPLRHFLGRLSARILPNKERPIPNFVEITDGGHFENLGLYELIRRRCKLIVVCDAEPDPKTSYASFTSAIRRVREDFGVEIKFNMTRDKYPDDNSKNEATKSGPQDLVARSVDDEYPSGALYATKGYFMASVTYPKNDGQHIHSYPKPDGYRASAVSNTEQNGLIIYLKSALISDVELTTKGYRGTNDQFPYDPTANQFFSPEQFEAYRDMGSKIAEQMISDLKLEHQGFESFLEDDELKLKEFPVMLVNPRL